MALNLKLPEIPKNLPKLKKGKIPSKNFINIQIKKKQVFSMQKNVPIIIAIVLIALVLGKFFIVDRITLVARETARLSKIQDELTTANKAIESMQDIDDVYAHYTTSGMTEEELSRVDRVAAMKLINKEFLRHNISKSWNLTGNVMTLQVRGPSLRELNDLAAELEENPIVERCVISSANKRIEESDDVAVTFVIYLQKPVEEEE